MHDNTFIDFNIVSIMTSIACWSIRLFLMLRTAGNGGSVHWHVLSVVNHGDASDGGDIDEWD